MDPKYQFPGHTELVDPCSAYSKPKPDFRGSKTGGFAPGSTHGSIQATTGMETLKKTAPLEVIPERAPELEVNKLY